MKYKARKKLYTGSEAARAAGVSRMSLWRWLEAGKIKPQYGSRFWTEKDVQRLKELAISRGAKKQRGLRLGSPQASRVGPFQAEAADDATRL